MTRAGWIIGLGVAAWPAPLLVHCDNVAPLGYTPPVRDAGAADAVDPRLVEACASCITSDAGCLAAYEMYTQLDSRCAGVVACLNASYCWATFDTKHLANLTPCEGACFAEAGISGLNEITASATRLYYCTELGGPCVGVCRKGVLDASGAD